MSTDANIFVGTWQNHNSAAWPTAWTLTLKQREGGILSAALVIFVGFAATQAWNVTKFILHQGRLGSTRNGFHQQLQAMLRNSNTHAEAAWYSIRIPFGWRRQSGGFARTLARTSPILIASLASVALWAVAQVSLSRIWTGAGNEFLIDSGVCGWVDGENEKFLLSGTRRKQAAIAHVNLCYEEAGAPTVQADSCRRLPRASIDWTISDAPCPFTDPDLCISTNYTPVTLDTGYLSSSADFGVNARREDTVLYRKVATCSPVTTAYQASPKKGVINFYYGPNAVYDTEPAARTYVHHVAPLDQDAITTLDYAAQAVYSDLDPSGVWHPNASITDRANATVTFVFVANPVAYVQPNYDPIFRTDDRATFDFVGMSLHNASAPVSILGCIEQQEMCNHAAPGDPVCVSIDHTTNGSRIEPLHLSGEKSATTKRLMVYTYSMAMVATGTSPLASGSLLLGVQWAEVPPTQWRREVTRWLSASLVMTQHGLIDSVTGQPADSGSVELPGAAASCRRQVVRNAVGFQNFNMKVIFLVLVLGSAIIALGLSIDIIVGAIQRRFLPASRGWVHWTLDCVFQLQRLAYYGVGVRSWRDEDTCISTIDGRSLLPVDRRTMAFSRCEREEELKLMKSLRADATADCFILLLNRPESENVQGPMMG